MGIRFVASAPTPLRKGNEDGPATWRRSRHRTRFFTVIPSRNICSRGVADGRFILCNDDMVGVRMVDESVVLLNPIAREGAARTPQ